MNLDESLDLAEEVVRRDYPSARVVRHVGQGIDVSGPGYHIVSVAVSDVFWDEPAERWNEVWAELPGRPGAGPSRASGYLPSLTSRPSS
ncbi:hypothetical protein COO58_16555 [Micromonospora sp. WMMA1996]|uniref:hypothetical protein n=1 Tax=Micromonospora sp. WMMA1996 TaxID=2039878 RepID=UPI000BF7309B|nr:hypothetical protein [Micromonospora sp. WMMA1996]PGH45860.1 hypothetical protein COO58_16555 [Micromonospora sp. WMMA1996]